MHRISVGAANGMWVHCSPAQLKGVLTEIGEYIHNMGERAAQPAAKVTVVRETAQALQDMVEKVLGKQCSTLKDAVYHARRCGHVDNGIIKKMEQLNAADSLLRHCSALWHSKLAADVQVALQGGGSESKGVFDVAVGYKKGTEFDLGGWGKSLETGAGSGEHLDHVCAPFDETKVNNKSIRNFEGNSEFKTAGRTEDKLEQKSEGKADSSFDVIAELLSHESCGKALHNILVKALAEDRDSMGEAQLEATCKLVRAHIIFMAANGQRHLLGDTVAKLSGTLT